MRRALKSRELEAEGPSQARALRRESMCPALGTAGSPTQSEQIDLSSSSLSLSFIC